MVEQRRILKLFMDEVTYFLERISHWETDPQMYPFITTQMRDPVFVRTSVVEPLLGVLREAGATL